MALPQSLVKSRADESHGPLGNERCERRWVARRSRRVLGTGYDDEGDENDRAQAEHNAHETSLHELWLAGLPELYANAFLSATRFAAAILMKMFSGYSGRDRSSIQRGDNLKRFLSRTRRLQPCYRVPFVWRTWVSVSERSRYVRMAQELFHGGEVNAREPFWAGG